MQMALESLLRESVDRYRALMRLQAEAGAALKSALSGRIEAIAGQMEEVQKEVEEVDHTLLPLLRREGTAVADHPLFRERQALLEECARQIRHLLPAAEAGKAEMLDELLRIRAGRTAMAGYGNGGRNQGNRMIGQV
jgi:hypothetical protein